MTKEQILFYLLCWVLFLFSVCLFNFNVRRLNDKKKLPLRWVFIVISAIGVIAPVIYCIKQLIS